MRASSSQSSAQAAHVDSFFLGADVLVRQVTAAACSQTFDIETGLDTDLINLNPLGWIVVSPKVPKSHPLKAACWHSHSGRYDHIQRKSQAARRYV